MTRYRYISADSHLECSPDLWRPYVAREFRDWVPEVVKLPGGGDGWLYRGAAEPVSIVRSLAGGLRGRARYTHEHPRSASYADRPPGAGDGNQRLAELDEDGVDAEILFPPIMHHYQLASAGIPAEAYVAVSRGYNDWLSSEFCAVDYGRLLGCAMLPVTSIDDAVDEVSRIAGMPGIRTVLLHQWPNGEPRPEPDADDRFWAVCMDTGLPISVHVQFGGGRSAEQAAPGPFHSVSLNQLMTRATGQGVDTGYCVSQLITSGAFDRFPTLRLAFAETGAGWVPFYAEQADTNYDRHRYWWGFELAHPPSYYVKKHFLWGIQDDYFAVRVRHEIGLGNLMWATDFPHHATDWPCSRDLIETMFAGVPDAERQQIIAGNAVDFYRLDDPRPDVLT
ncbi:MAG: amidohydrolase family protein [Actinomycetota bacterium]|nr:amidohydrolase family protein [Actinomycetota bacterium]